MASLSKKDLEYRHESNAVSLINMHFVFIPKRRKAVLVGKIAQRLQEIIFEVVTENRWRIIALEIMQITYIYWLTLSQLTPLVLLCKGSKVGLPVT